MVWEMNRTEPSPKAKLAPPVCMLLNPRARKLQVDVPQPPAPLPGVIPQWSYTRPVRPVHWLVFRLTGRLVPLQDPVLVFQIRLLDEVTQSASPIAMVLLRPS